MSISSCRAAAVCPAFGSTAFARTPSRYDTVKQNLLIVQQKAAESLSLLDAPVRPANWQTLISTQMNAAAGAATAAATAALSATTSRFVSVPPGREPAGGGECR